MDANIPDLSTITVMRGEVSAARGLVESLKPVVHQMHFVETATEAASVRELSALGVAVHHHPLPYGMPFDGARNVAVSDISTDWVFIIDTDERLPGSLTAYLQNHLVEWNQRGIDAVYFPRRSHVLGMPLRRSGSWPDYQLRLLRTDVATFRDTLHDFNPAVNRPIYIPERPELAILHYNFDSTFAYVNKINLYSSIEARSTIDDLPGPRPRAALVAALRDFLARYVKARGFLDGRAGLHFAVVMAFYRYLQVAKRGESLGPVPGNLHDSTDD